MPSYSVVSCICLHFMTVTVITKRSVTNLSGTVLRPLNVNENVHEVSYLHVHDADDCCRYSSRDQGSFCRRMNASANHLAGLIFQNKRQRDTNRSL
jgi:hypothetical protein